MGNTPADLPAIGGGLPETYRPSAETAREIDQMDAAWQRGERPRAEDVLARLPGLRDEDAVRIVFEEACLRQEAGEASVSAEILRRFPQWRQKLELLFDCNRLLWPASESYFPEAGEDVGDFHLVCEIGRGAHGRTFLARQHSLADRLVVLKVTPTGHGEHLTLAGLQHMHIVPLYFEQVLPERNVRVMGMPYLGGTSLNRILEALREVPAEQRLGRQIVEALDRLAPAPKAEGPASGAIRKFLAQASYVQAVCWIGACLADALQYAHERGLVHMDVKPSNVLIAGDGQPMLLDFHLAQGPIRPGDPVPEQIGGTPGFLSPEQERVMAAIHDGGPVTDAVDGRSDVYSLGLLLYGALGGDAGPGGSPGRPLERCNPRVSRGLSDIIAKCLARAPRDRYRDASALAADLRRHLNDQRLLGVSNRSPVERCQKWRRRHPAALARGVVRLGLAATVVAAIVAAALSSYNRTRQVEAALAEGRDLLSHGRYAEAQVALQSGLKLASRLPQDDRLERALRDALQQASREQAVAELHGLVDSLRFRYGISPPSDEEARSLFRRGSEVWKRRSLLVSAGGPTEPQVRTDLLDLATILASLRAHEGTSDEALRESAQLLRDARAEFGPAPALDRDLRAFAEALGQTVGSPCETQAPRTPWEHYDLGRSYLRSGDYARADREFRQSVKQQPGEFWPHFFRGVCAYRLGRYEDALAALDTCVALSPKTAECYYNRAKVYAALGQKDEARDDYARALERNPALAGAALNRGILWYEAGQHERAIEDFERARRAASDPETRGRVEYHIALVHLARKDRSAAEASLKRAISYGDGGARDLLGRLGRP